MDRAYYANVLIAHIIGLSVHLPVPYGIETAERI